MADMGIGMVSQGRMAFTPKRIRGIQGLKAIIAGRRNWRPSMPELSYNYFPGCSLERNAEAYHKSSTLRQPRLGLTVRGDRRLELLRRDRVHLASYAGVLRAHRRNLAQAVKSNGGRDLVAPCSACYLNLKKCDKYMRADVDLAEKRQPGAGRGRAVV
jgi:hypothetical protein